MVNRQEEGYCFVSVATSGRNPLMVCSVLMEEGLKIHPKCRTNLFAILHEDRRPSALEIILTIPWG